VGVEASDRFRHELGQRSCQLARLSRLGQGGLAHGLSFGLGSGGGFLAWSLLRQHDGLQVGIELGEPGLGVLRPVLRRRQAIDHAPILRLGFIVSVDRVFGPVVGLLGRSGRAFEFVFSVEGPVAFASLFGVAPIKQRHRLLKRQCAALRRRLSSLSHSSPWCLWSES
jgi:hypothetical protein